MKSIKRINYEDVDTLVAHHDAELLKILNSHAPLQTRFASLRKSAPWFNTEIKQEKKKRRQAERRWRHSKLTVHKEIFQAHNQRVNKLIKTVKQDYFVSKINVYYSK